VTALLNKTRIAPNVVVMKNAQNAQLIFLNNFAKIGEQTMRDRNAILREIEQLYEDSDGYLTQEDVKTLVMGVVDEVEIAVDEIVDTLGKVDGIDTLNFVEEGYDALCNLSSDLGEFVPEMVS
jgi:hypothetical protein